MSANPRPLAGMLPWEDRTFLSIGSPKRASSSGCPTAQAISSMASTLEFGVEYETRIYRKPRMPCLASRWGRDRGFACGTRLCGGRRRTTCGIAGFEYLHGNASSGRGCSSHPSRVASRPSFGRNSGNWLLCAARSRRTGTDRGRSLGSGQFAQDGNRGTGFEHA